MELSTKEQEYEVLYQQKKKRLRMNIVEFLLGLVLLVFAFNYLKSHPAERTSMFAGIEVLFQRAEVFVSNIFGEDGSLLQDKHQLERYYKELISTMENGDCADVATREAAREKYKMLQSIDMQTYKENLQLYQGYAGTYAAKIKENCGE